MAYDLINILHFKLRNVGPYESFIEKQLSLNTQKTKNHFFYLLACKNARSINQPTKKGWLQYFGFFLGKKHSFSLIHAHFGSNAIFAVPLSIILNIPLIVSFYGYDYSAFPKSFFGLGEILLRIVFLYCDKVVAMTPHMKTSLIKLGCPEKKIIIHLVKPEVLEYEKSPVREIKNLVMISSFKEKKNHKLVFTALSQSQADFQLNLYGSGPLEDELRSLAQKLGLKVNFKGTYNNQKELQSIYEDNELLLHPSKTGPNGDMEGLPTTILEAMACNVPCVCTNHAGIKDIAKNGVFYTDSKDSSELKNLLEKIKFNPELAQQKQQEAASRFHIIFPNSKKSDCHFPYNTILKELSNN